MARRSGVSSTRSPVRTARGGAAPARANPTGRPVSDPASFRGSRRRAVEAASALPLLWLRGLPRGVVAVLPVALVGLGFLAPPVIGLIPIAAAVAFLGWLGYLSWPAISPGARAARLGVIAALLAIGLIRAVHR